MEFHKARRRASGIVTYLILEQDRHVDVVMITWTGWTTSGAIRPAIERQAPRDRLPVPASAR